MAVATSSWPSALLDARGIRKRFGQLQVLDGVDLSVAPGEVVAVVGENGAGKSTLARCIARTLVPDEGEVFLRGRPVGPDQEAALLAGIGVVWQDLALCDNLDTVANLFLGRERRRRLFLLGADMHGEARRLLDGLGIDVPDLTRPVGSLSGGQRQAIAVARALDRHPAVLILDEPTASLGVVESRTVDRLIRDRRDAGTAILLITHRLDQVFEVADRIVVLRHGRIVGDVSPLEVHPDDVVAMISGVEVDSTARRQLGRLRSLVEQLSEVEPSASLPLIVTAMAAALGLDKVCVHLLDGDRLRRSAAVGLSGALLDVHAEVPLSRAGGPVGLAAATGSVVVAEDVRVDPTWEVFRGAAIEAGIQSSWAAPIIGATGVLGTVSGYGDTVGRPPVDQLELITLYTGHAAAAIERERLYAESRRRNRVLEAIRTVLEVLAGPDHVARRFDAALVALCEVLGAGAAAVRVEGGSPPAPEAAVDVLGGRPAAGVLDRLDVAAAIVLGGSDEGRVGAPHAVELAVPLVVPGGRGALAVHWGAPAVDAGEAEEVLRDVARSLSLALEREALESAHLEAEALRHSQRMQRDFLSRLSHELRTPLTAIHGCADSLRQPDVDWDGESTSRFLATIASESQRMRRLVADLLDVSAIDAGLLRIHPDWCDLRLVLDSSAACVGGAAESVEIDVAEGFGPVWADHDRLEQVFVNLLHNATVHGSPPVEVCARRAPGDGGVEIRVTDAGRGITPEVGDVFDPHVRGERSGGTGLGLAIARGIARAHGGSLELAATLPGTTFVVVLPGEPDAEERDA